MQSPLTPVLPLVLLALTPFAQDALPIVSSEAAPEVDLVWDAAKVEHLMNRAGFGVRADEAEKLAALGRDALIERLLSGGVPRGEYFAENVMRPTGENALERAERLAVRRDKRRRDTRQLADFSEYWVERMVGGDDPLREKMTLFWHGHFASSQRTIRDSYAMIRQNELFYRDALGSFADMAHGIVRDAAMLEYLDNDQNKKGKPNENLARELMELFLLGEGQYEETDVKEAARALTGWSQRAGEFREVRRLHDRGDKTVLGRTGPLDGDGLVDLLLEQDACGPFVAGKVIAFFEGVEPDPARAEEYGRAFAASGYDVAGLLRRLFRDPAFYSDAVVANRITSPIEDVVGTCTRLGIDPPPRLVVASARVLGQELFAPPSVKGWDEGEAWITTSSFMLRGNLAGVLLGIVELEELVSAPGPAPAMRSDVVMDELDEPGGPMAGADDSMRMSGEAPKQPKRALGDLSSLKRLSSMAWRPRMSLSARMKAAGKNGDGAIVDTLLDELLAVPAGPETRAFVLAELRKRREAAGLDKGKLLRDRQAAERVLREVAHVVLSLPEAQLN